ncbi:phytanoyl-CoA dioxygenase family protein [Pseudochryseolinea flava]|uniref:Phytanoyl-CoA dioxygenase n=1 Tax=Pseudochryseolinea flava TaxID=2059302 RepID=A0A364Y767_9BACT|nr:WYL domain-containing protein [Pseudochryseolinea flava]RAW02911.1 phytanoyl-CoA dioxygenase [Pseudochryseolinea flava]
MPVNRNALIRYRTIDNCLRNRQRRWTLEDLIEACSEALYEYEGIDKGLSKRSVQMDIQMMRSDKLGYNAPIIVLEKKYYTYDDPDYSITNIPLTDQDLNKLTEVVEILRQFKGFSHFQELSGMVQRLENKIHSAKTKQEPIIDFEKNENLKGLEYIETLYQSIINKCAIEIVYQSFKARSANTFNFHPHYLKEYRNRWFVVGVKKKNTPIMVLALDRIISVSPCALKYVSNQVSLPEYFNDALGVTINVNARVENVVLLADHETAPYIATKPIHHSQEKISSDASGVVFALKVQINPELEREILGFGSRVRILAPEKLKKRITGIFADALESYMHEFSPIALTNAAQKLIHRGSSIINHVFNRKEVNYMRTAIYEYFKKAALPTDTHAVRNLFQEIPALNFLLQHTNIKTILDAVAPNLRLTKAIYFDKTPTSNWYVTWHQDIIINVSEKIETEGFTGWTKKSGVHGVCPPDEVLKNTLTIRIHLDDTDENNGALKVLPGSHHKRFTDEEISTITKNSIPNVCEVRAGGVHLMRPLILHASSKATSQNRRRVLHLEFNTMTLPNGLQWAEQE